MLFDNIENRVEHQKLNQVAAEFFRVQNCLLKTGSVCNLHSHPLSSYCFVPPGSVLLYYKVVHDLLGPTHMLMIVYTVYDVGQITIFLAWLIELNTKSSTKFLVFNSAFGYHRHWSRLRRYEEKSAPSYVTITGDLLLSSNVASGLLHFLSCWS